MSEETEKTEEAKDWYKPGPKIAEFHLCKDVFIRVLMGGRGCGKTFSACTEAIWHCWYNKGARVRIFRKWGSSNEDSVKDTLMEIFKNLGSLFVDTGRTLFAIKDGGSRFRIPSTKAIELWTKFCNDNPDATITEKENWLSTTGERYCGHIILDGLPDADKANAKTRSNQCSMMIFVEADQIEETYVNMGIGSVRLPDADGDPFKDYSVIIESNPPSTKHWLAKWEHGDMSDSTKPRKPRENCRFWHIPSSDNQHNVPGGERYVQGLKDAYAHSPDEYARFVMGEYADVFPGTPVVKTFDPNVHIKKDLGFPRGSTLIRGWDYGGSNNACVWLSYFIDKEGYEHFWALKELWLQNSSVEEQATEVKRITEEYFPDPRDKSEINALYDFGDIAGNQRSATGSVVNVLSTFGIYPGATKMNIQESLAILIRLMSSRDAQGRPLFLIDPDGCPKLTNALKGEYRYPMVGEPGWGAAIQEPLKGEACNNADHICFVEGTKLDTLFGKKDVKDITLYDVMWTRDGYKPVESIFKSYDKEIWKLTLSNGTSLQGTGNHPIWVKGMGFVPLEKLKTGYSLLNTEESYIDFIQNKLIVGILNGITSIFIEKFGWTTLGSLFQKAIISTILTKIKVTTYFQTWNLSRVVNTLVSTTVGSVRNLLGNIWRKSEYLPKNGMLQKKEGNGIENTELKDGTQDLCLPSPVRYVEQPFTQSKPLEDSVVTTARAKVLLDEIQVTSVERLYSRATVYNISVKDKHEYFANGILVSNCDSLRYSVANMFRLLKVGTTGPLKRHSKVNPKKIAR